MADSVNRANYVDAPATGLSRAAGVYRRRGVVGICKAAAGKAAARLNAVFGYTYYRLFKSAQFTFDGRVFDYFFHPYNRTWSNERAVEVPLIMDSVRRCEGRRILEVGNVLSHYYMFAHDIVDKYEKDDGVVNMDILDYKPALGYDLIVSISTLEHVGYDDAPIDRMKIIRAVEHLRGLLAKGGKMVVALPLGYNPSMDDDIKNGRLRFLKQWCLKRISSDNRWQETEIESVGLIRYDEPYTSANGLFIGVDIKK